MLRALFSYAVVETMEEITSEDEEMETEFYDSLVAQNAKDDLLELANEVALRSEDTGSTKDNLELANDVPEAALEHSEAAVVEHEKEPQDDKQAIEALYRIAGRRWKTVKESIYVWHRGLWTQGESAFFELAMQHSDRLGKYGKSVTNMRHLMVLARTKNVEDDSWTQQLDRLAPGLVPFVNGIYDIKTSTLRCIDPEDMITKKFDFNAPSILDEDVSAEIRELNSVLNDLLPDEQLRLEVMVRLAESFFSCTNTHKYLVQLYGQGNNGKTTLMRIMQTAFPQWVQMPKVQHLVVGGGTSRDPNAPQQWLVDVMGARILGFEEPGEKQTFDGALLKLLRGNGVVTGRALYKQDVSYVPTYTLWIAANAPIEVKPHDQAMHESLHSFRLPSFFCNGNAPLGTQYPKKKIPDLHSRFTTRQYKLALFHVLREHYEIYTRDHTLPPLKSKYVLQDIYKDEHPTVSECIERCLETDEKEKLRASVIYSVLEDAGCKESHKKMHMVLMEHFAKIPFVQVRNPGNVKTWYGLSLRHAD